jgi:spore coat polysaccharide biosynthesis protein SpsF
MKIGAIIQARTSSTRLPGKVLKYLPYNSKVTVLGQVIRRLKKSSLLDMIIVATSTDIIDERIVDIAVKENVTVFRGSLDNVLERYYLAAVEYDLDIVVRVTSDCPCIDPGIVDYAVINHLESAADYTSNSLIRSFPHGLDVEVFNFNVLEKAYLEATHDFEQEITAPDIRITLDTIEDYALLCTVYDYLYPTDNFFNIGDIVNLFKVKPWLKLINKNILAKKSFNNFDDELLEALKLLELQELYRIKKFLEENVDSCIK